MDIHEPTAGARPACDHDLPLTALRLNAWPLLSKCVHPISLTSLFWRVQEANSLETEIVSSLNVIAYICAATYR